MDEELSRPVLAYVGVPGRLEDGSPEDRVVQVAGGEAGIDLMPRIQDLVEDLYNAEPPLWAADSVAEVGRRAQVWLSSRHAELSEEAIWALANQFAFDWR